jgi:hypothetical protein
MVFASASGSEAYRVLAYPLFEGPGASVYQIAERGVTARWFGDGSGLVFRSGQSWYRVSVTGESGRPFSSPELILEGNFLLLPGGDSFAVSRDGNRFLMIQGASEYETTVLEVRTNWVAELESILPRGEE